MATANFHDITTLGEIQLAIGDILVKLDKLQPNTAPGTMRYEAINSHLMAAHENIVNQIQEIHNSFEERK